MAFSGPQGSGGGGSGISNVVEDLTPELGGDLAMDAQDLSTDTTTGTKIGTGATQKLAFWNATPVVQPGHLADLSSNLSAGGDTLDLSAAQTTINGINTRINDILADLAELGLQASS